MSVTHVAGPVVCIRSIGLVLQRCAVCGEKLCDNRGQMAPLNPDGTPPQALTWPERHYIHCEGEQPRCMRTGGDFADDNVPVPDDFCLALVEPGNS